MSLFASPILVVSTVRRTSQAAQITLYKAKRIHRGLSEHSPQLRYVCTRRCQYAAVPNAIILEQPPQSSYPRKQICQLSNRQHEFDPLSSLSDQGWTPWGPEDKRRALMGPPPPNSLTPSPSADRQSCRSRVREMGTYSSSLLAPFCLVLSFLLPICLQFPFRGWLAAPPRPRKQLMSITVN